jgi:pyruvate-ferredoxin/flavodoxin oxidoreductase
MSPLRFGKKNKDQGKKGEGSFKYPGSRAALDGNSAVIMCERESSDAAGAYPITPSTQMGEYWAEAAAAGHINVSGRPLIFIEPEGEHAAAAVTAGMSMTGMRSANFSSGQGIAYMHESLYAAVGKRLTYVLNVGARAMTKSTLNVHAGHDDYHCVDDTGFFQMFAKNAQAAADLNIISHRIAELALTPGIIAQDGFLTTHLIESMLVPERELIAEYLGQPDDIIETPTPAQKIIYGDTRRRIPLLWDVDNPVMAGLVENQDSYMQGVAAQRPFFFDHIQALTEQAFEDFYALTGRHYSRVMTYRADDADYLIVGQGSMIPSAEAVVDYLRESRGLKVGVVDMLMFRPFPGDLIGQIIQGKKGVTVLERLDQPLAVDLPLMREIRATVSKCLENGKDARNPVYPELAAYKSLNDAPALYSGSFGMGSRDLQPEGIVGAVENMLENGPRKKLFYLSIDFLRDEAITPKQEMYQQTIQEAYPDVKALAIRGSENPNLMPEGSITVRFHSIGGWGAITTGKNLAMTLFDLLGYHMKANPKYGSEKKGQPTTYYLSAAPEPIKINCEYFYVDVVLSPDPNVFGHTNALAGLKEGGVFVIQSDKGSSEEMWESIPPMYQKIIIDKKIKVYFLDAFKIARDEATDPDLQLRMQGIAFQGAFFAASPVIEQAGLNEEKLLNAIHDQLQEKFGSKGRRVVEDNVRVVKRGFEEIHEMIPGPISGTDNKAAGSKRKLPVMVKPLPQSKAPMSDIHRFWEQTGSFYARGMGNDNLTDPFIGLGVMPPSSALFRDMTGIRFDHPEWIAENCTACGDCYTICPDTAIPGLVNEVGQVFDTIVNRVRKNGHGAQIEHLPKAAKVMERNLHGLFQVAQESDSVSMLLDKAMAQTVEQSELLGGEKEKLRKELDFFKEELNGFQFALTRPHYTLPEQDQPGSGGLLSITVNPYTCKGCMECVEVCSDDALRPMKQTAESVQLLRDNWDVWTDLPTTPAKYIRVDDLEEGIGALQTILLDKDNYLPFTSGDGACLGCSEKTSLHIFIATVEALMQPRIAKHLAHVSDLIARLKKHIQLRLAGEINVSDPDMMAKVVDDIDRAGGEAGTTQVEVRRWDDWPRPDQHGHDQQHRLHLGLGQHVSVQPLPVSLGQPPLPGLPVHGDGHLRRAHGQDGRRLQGHPHRRARAGGQVPARRARRVPHLLQLARVHRRGVGALPACGRGGWRRSDVRHRFPEPLPGHGLGHAHQGACGGHSGLLQHRWPGLYLWFHRPDFGHGAVRKGHPGQAGASEGDRPDRHGAPQYLRDAEHHLAPESHDRRLHPGAEGPAASALQSVQHLSAGARHRRRHERSPIEAGGRVESVPALPVRPRRRQDAPGVFRSRGQPAAGSGLAELHHQVPGRRCREGDGASADFCRLRDHRRSIPKAVPGRAA